MEDPMTCPHEKRLDNVERKYESLSESLKKMEDKFDAKLDLILMQINKVAILEEKHTYQSAALGRAFDKLENVEKDMEKLVAFKNHVEGMARMAYVIWGAMGISIVGVVVKVFGGS